MKRSVTINAFSFIQQFAFLIFHDIFLLFFVIIRNHRYILTSFLFFCSYYSSLAWRVYFKWNALTYIAAERYEIKWTKTWRINYCLAGVWEAGKWKCWNQALEVIWFMIFTWKQQSLIPEAYDGFQIYFPSPAIGCCLYPIYILPLRRIFRLFDDNEKKSEYKFLFQS